MGLSQTSLAAAGGGVSGISLVFAATKPRPPPILAAVVLGFTNYDLLPPSVTFVDPFTRQSIPAKLLQLQMLRRMAIPGATHETIRRRASHQKRSNGGRRWPDPLQALRPQADTALLRRPTSHSPLQLQPRLDGQWRPGVAASPGYFGQSATLLVRTPRQPCRGIPLLPSARSTPPAAERPRSSSITSISDHPSATSRSRIAYCSALLSRLCST